MLAVLPAERAKLPGGDKRLGYMIDDASSSPKTSGLPFGRRVYAFSGIQGDLALFRRLLLQVYCDSRLLRPSDTTLLILGGFKCQKGTFELAMSFARNVNLRVKVLRDATEASIDPCYGRNIPVHSEGDKDKAEHASWDHARLPDQYAAFPSGEAYVPPAIRDWIQHLPTSWMEGDYVFSSNGVQLRRGSLQEAVLDLVEGRFVGPRSQDGDAIVRSRPAVEGGSRPAAMDSRSVSYRTVSALAFEGDERRVIDVSDEPSNFIMNELEPGHDAAIDAMPLDNSLLINDIEHLISAIAAPPITGDRDRRSDPGGLASHVDPVRVVDSPGAVAEPPAGGWRRLPILATFVVFASISLVRPSGIEMTNRLSPPFLGVHGAPHIDHDRTGSRIDSPPVEYPRCNTATFMVSTQIRNARFHTRAKRSQPAHRQTFRSHVGRTSFLPEATTPLFGMKAVHLTGEALAAALAQDHLATQRLNNAELRSIQHRRIRGSIFKRRVK